MTKHQRVVFGVALLAVLISVLSLSYGATTVKRTYAPTSNSAQSATDGTIDHIFVLINENHPASSVIDNRQAPYLNGLMRDYGLATNYSATTHPSLPNYIALTSGSTQNITNDCNPPRAGCIVQARSIADTLEQSGRTWKEYAQDMPGACGMTNSGNYVTKHNPFVYYDSIANNASRCQSHVVPYSQLSDDLHSTTTTPTFAFISPDLCNDTHDCPLSTGDAWLASAVPAILNAPAFTQQHSLLVITWDEGNSSDNKVATIFIGPAAKRHYTSNNSYGHYSLLHTIENAWHLPTLTANDANAPLMTEFLQ